MKAWTPTVDLAIAKDLTEAAAIGAGRKKGAEARDTAGVLTVEVFAHAVMARMKGLGRKKAGGQAKDIAVEAGAKVMMIASVTEAIKAYVKPEPTLQGGMATAAVKIAGSAGKPKIIAINSGTRLCSYPCEPEM